jgi:hypothetical protein
VGPTWGGEKVLSRTHKGRYLLRKMIRVSLERRLGFPFVDVSFVILFNLSIMILRNT